VAWVIALLSLFVWFGVTAWNMTGPDEGMYISIISTVVTQTQLGHVSITRFLVLVLAGVCLFASRRPSVGNKGHVLRSSIVALATLNLLTLAFVGPCGCHAWPGGRLGLDR
jgi:putative copper export protein